MLKLQQRILNCIDKKVLQQIHNCSNVCLLCLSLNDICIGRLQRRYYLVTVLLKQREAKHFSCSTCSVCYHINNIGSHFRTSQLLYLSPWPIVCRQRETHRNSEITKLSWDTVLYHIQQFVRYLRPSTEQYIQFLKLSRPVMDGMICKEMRIVIPPCLRPQLIQLIQKSHFGKFK